jgi:hypothetical protein
MGSEGNWIQTETQSMSRTLWAVVRDGEAIQSGELDGDDPSGMRAYEAAIKWAATHCPGVAFGWKHRAPGSRRGPVKP